ncbi:LANO_0H08878g1_1 [Lachancea nothofagi CBS 11611]|uniref:LANO_0H08878g1_1 n=1 Tax=Lachancea nothofagi CBS 11611 TaxID=1266666 RepID=A0A1G4KM05_9SACH|nr:LANO_0H08878g1_1 [Lachancea nothofagi CBS 11611]
MSSVVLHPSNKRSISSSIVNFFKKDTPTEYHDSRNANKASSVSSNIQDADTTELPSVPDLVLYDSENGERPPLLPIMPLQRLKILRHKQYLRRLQDSYLPSLITSSFESEKPSKIAKTQLLPLRSLKRNSQKAIQRSKQPTRTVLGKRWSGDLEYDLAEYDVVKKPKNSKPKDSVDSSTTMESPRLSPTVLKKSTTGGKVSAGPGLSRIQATLLDGKSLVDLSASKDDTKISTPTKNGTASEKSKPLLALPSSGFDFLKADGKSGQASSELDSSKAGENVSPPKFTFGGANVKESSATDLTTSSDRNLSLSDTKQSPGSKSAAHDKTKPLSFGTTDKGTAFSFGGGSGGSAQSKPSFAFGKSQTSSKGGESKPVLSFGQPSSQVKEKDAEDKQESGNKPFSFKPSPSAFTFNGPNQNKPGVPEQEAIKEKETKDDAKSVSEFGSNTLSKPVFDFGSKPSNPAFDSVHKPTPESASTSGTQPAVKPAFSFGGTGAQNDNEKDIASEPSSKKVPSFTFGAPKEAANDTKDKPPAAFSFGSSKPAIVQSSAPNNFSFGSVNSSKPASSEGGSMTKPSFSFTKLSDSTGAHDARNASTAPQLGSKPSITSSKSFGFGVPSEKKDSTPPAFSFGGNSQNNNQSSSSINGSSFKFDSNAGNSGAIQSNQPPKPPFSAASSSGIGKPAFSFGAGTPPVVNAPQPQQPQSSIIPPSQSNGFGFASGSTTSNNSPAFGNPANNQQLAFNFGTGNTSASSTPPPFGGTGVPAFAPPNPQSRPFSPSHTVNLNFGGAASQAPSSIFGGTTSSTPAQMFGGQPSNSNQSFGNTPQNPAQVFGGSNPGAMPQQQNQSSMMNLPPGRKLARMRARRN